MSPIYSLGVPFTPWDMDPVPANASSPENILTPVNVSISRAMVCQWRGEGRSPSLASG